MMVENTFITEVVTPEGAFAGEPITASTWAEAKAKCPEYATVVGQLRFTFNTYELN